jgi:hypothetical protein
MPGDARDPDPPLRHQSFQAQVFLTRARRALGLLTAQPGCLGGQLGRSPDDITRWVLAAAEGGAVTDHGSLLAPDTERGFGPGAR